MTKSSTITFGTFVTFNGERRIYVNGTTRKVWFTKDVDGSLKGNSDALRPQTNTSALYQKREKDRAALGEARGVARDLLGLEAGETIMFETLWEKVVK
jgi:hypothetical protein